MPIKDLQTLVIFAPRRAIDIKGSPKETFYRAKTKHASRPGGLSYPKETFRRDTLLILVNRDNPVNPAHLLAWRGTGPRPTVAGEFWHGEGQALALRCQALFSSVARGPVPRELSARDTPARDRFSNALRCQASF